MRGGMSNFNPTMHIGRAGRGQGWQSKGERQIALRASLLAPKSAVIAADNSQGRERRQPGAGIALGPSRGGLAPAGASSQGFNRRIPTGEKRIHPTPDLLPKPFHIFYSQNSCFLVCKYHLPPPRCHHRGVDMSHV